MVLGEAQILGQCKDAYGFAFEAGTTGRIFNKLWRQSFEVGKRVRTETEIGESAVSISYAAIELAKKVFDDLDGKTVLILGAGKMSELTAKHLVANGIGRVVVANRTYERAAELAEKFGGDAITFESMFDHMHEADIVISSTAATHYVITKDKVAGSMKGRHSRPLFLIDIAVPRDIDPECGSVAGVFLYDIDDLNGVVESNLEERMREARHAETIVEEEMAAFAAWLEGMEVVPTIAAMRARAEEIRQQELGKALKRLSGLSEKELKTVEALTSSIVNKMLHDPTSRLREAAADKDGYELVEATRQLYGLDEPEKASGGLLKGLLHWGEKTRTAKDEVGDTLGA
jgi:glutamyl-tRNA reductase